MTEEQLAQAQDKRRLALIERLGTVADLACQTPLPGELGDVAYDLLRQAAAQISSDRLRFTRLAADQAARTTTTEDCDGCAGHGIGGDGRECGHCGGRGDLAASPRLTTPAVKHAADELRALAALIERPPLDDVMLEKAVALRAAAAIGVILQGQGL